MKNYNIDLKFFKNDPTYYFEKERFGKSFFYNVSYKGYEAKVYVFELYKILSNESFPLFGKKETLNGLSLIPIYIEGFKKGKEFFKSKYTVSTEILFQNINEYVKTLQTCYCHKEQGQGKRGWCWYSWNYPFIFNDEKIKEYGYFAGIISEIDELKEHYHQFKVIGQCDHSLIPQQTETKTEQEQPKIFEELFYNPEHAEPCLKILSELQPPVIDAINNYIGKAKGVFPLWVKVLKNHKPEPLIKHFKDTVYKDLLNQKVKGLNLTKDASEFRKEYVRLVNNNVELDIKTILSQYSQSGKLGK